ncbi:MAG: phosphatase PAP2 family protein [Myxococcaceae bacterium]|nr:phosphatase PAP2 family protein [Myxococcaceae bacterium]
MHDFRWGWDETVFSAINGLGIGWLDGLFVLASSRGFMLTVGLSLLAWVLYKERTQRYGVVAHVAVTVAMTDAFGAYVLKPFFGRMRPCYALAEGTFRYLSPASNVGSLPSLHAANAFAVAAALSFWRPKLAWVAMPLAALIAVSRVGVGVHWPTDVLAGALYGSAVGSAVYVVARRWLLAPRATLEINS